VTNGGWVNSPADSSTDSDSSAEFSESENLNEIGEEQLIDSSDDDTIKHIDQNYTRSITCPDIYTK
jgi:hypothetical protein